MKDKVSELVVTQADREAAAALLDRIGGIQPLFFRGLAEKVEGSTFVRLTPLGLEVRAILERQSMNRTRDKLAEELRKVAAKASPPNAAKYEAFAKRAETGEFDDYADTYVCPITQLYSELTAAGFTKFAARVANGEFDATKEESDEWARSPSGQEAAKHLSPEVRKVLGLDLLN